MTDAELEVIRAHRVLYPSYMPPVEADALLAEVDRLREANLKMLREMSRCYDAVRLERDACAILADRHIRMHAVSNEYIRGSVDTALLIATAIRQRGES